LEHLSQGLVTHLGARNLHAVMRSPEIQNIEAEVSALSDGEEISFGLAEIGGHMTNNQVNGAYMEVQLQSNDVLTGQQLNNKIKLENWVGNISCNYNHTIRYELLCHALGSNSFAPNGELLAPFQFISVCY
jgi:hypothetical protein